APGDRGHLRFFPSPISADAIGPQRRSASNSEGEWWQAAGVSCPMPPWLAMARTGPKLEETAEMSVIAPPFTLESAREKVRLAENAWNGRDPQKVSLAYTPDSRWRNRAEFVTGREEIVAF